MTDAHAFEIDALGMALRNGAGGIGIWRGPPARARIVNTHDLPVGIEFALGVDPYGGALDITLPSDIALVSGDLPIPSGGLARFMKVDAPA